MNSSRQPTTGPRHRGWRKKFVPYLTNLWLARLRSPLWTFCVFLSERLERCQCRRTAPLLLTSIIVSACSFQVTTAPSFRSSTPTGQNHGQDAGQDAGKRLPDPRYRSPAGIWEIDLVASKVAKASGSEVRGQITTGSDPGPLCRSRGPLGQGTIEVNPRAARDVPPNSWAFIIGHEFAHQIHRFGSRDGTSPQLELRADLIGAEYARKAGFDLAAHLGWMFARPNRYSDSHGEWHGRAEAIARHFGISPGEVGVHVDRYRQMRW